MRVYRPREDIKSLSLDPHKLTSFPSSTVQLITGYIILLYLIVLLWYEPTYAKSKYLLRKKHWDLANVQDYKDRFIVLEQRRVQFIKKYWEFERSKMKKESGRKNDGNVNEFMEDTSSNEMAETELPGSIILKRSNDVSDTKTMVEGLTDEIEICGSIKKRLRVKGPPI